MTALPTPPKSAFKAILHDVEAERRYAGFAFSTTLGVDAYQAGAWRSKLRQRNAEELRVESALKPWCAAFAGAVAPFDFCGLEIDFSGAPGDTKRWTTPETSDAGAAMRAFLHAQFFALAREMARHFPEAPEAIVRARVSFKSNNTYVMLSDELGGQSLDFHAAPEIQKLENWLQGVRLFTLDLKMQRPSGHILAAAARDRRGGRASS